MAGDTQIDPLFLESQLAALLQVAETGTNAECIVSLYSDGSLMVERHDGRTTTTFAFDSVYHMIETIGEYRRD